MDYAEALEVFFAPAPEGLDQPAVPTTPERRLRDALEPIAMHGIWSRSVNDVLAGHGYDFLSGYVAGRGSALGDVPSAVVAATFGVFEPGVVAALWGAGRALLPLPELVRVRNAAASASLRETLAGLAKDDDVAAVATVLEDAAAPLDVTARPLFAALRAQPRLEDAYGRLWRAADVVREHRGDSHLAACIAAGLDPVRMGVLSETWLGYPVGEYSGTRAWPEEAHAAGVARLEADGLIADGRITEQGRTLRDRIEADTDAAQAGLVAGIADLDGVVARLEAWSARCVEVGAFPPDPRKRAAG